MILIVSDKTDIHPIEDKYKLNVYIKWFQKIKSLSF